MTRAIVRVTLVVRDYDEAISYYTRVLGLDLIEDADLGGGKRWVVVGSRGGRGASLLLARAATPEQAARIGDQTGGRVAFFMHTNEFRNDYELMKAKGVEFIEAPRQESYGMVVVFRDLYGNKWDLVESRDAIKED